MSELSDDHEEYDPHSTVTDEERFAPLSTVALSLFSDLAQRYSVTVSAAFDASPTMSPIGNAYPPITRSPSDGGATLSVAFPSSVSLVLRCGWWHAESFPSCSCDGCDLTLAREAERFVELCAAVVAGTVHEALETAPVWYGSARLSHTFNSTSSARSFQTALPPQQAAILRGSRPPESSWMSWVARVRDAASRAPGLPRFVVEDVLAVDVAEGAVRQSGWRRCSTENSRRQHRSRGRVFTKSSLSMSALRRGKLLV